MAPRLVGVSPLRENRSVGDLHLANPNTVSARSTVVVPVGKSRNTSWTGALRLSRSLCCNAALRWSQPPFPARAEPSGANASQQTARFLRIPRLKPRECQDESDAQRAGRRGARADHAQRDRGRKVDLKNTPGGGRVVDEELRRFRWSRFDNTPIRFASCGNRETRIARTSTDMPRC